MATVLIIEDEKILARNVAESLAMSGHDTVVAHVGEDGLDKALTHAPDVVLLDYRLPTIDGLEILRRLAAEGTGAAIVMMTAHGEVHTAVEAMKAGAADFLTKPLDLDELQLIVERVLRQRNVNDKLAYFRQRERRESQIEGIIGESEPMRRVKDVIRRISSTSALQSADPPSLLITGETGTGKDLVARAIHYSGPRHGGQFVHVNCTAIPANLVESELFGHVQGAFTDAREARCGLFEVAEAGTLFLDEIGDMRPGLQAKLLSALDERAIRPVGATRRKPVNVHVIAATNRDIEAAIAAREFREDLFHRLRVLHIEIPPLRQRGDDVLLLARRFLQDVAARFSLEIDGFDPAAEQAMCAYPWPGNVRELLHAVESAVLVADGRQVQPAHLRLPQSPGTVLSIDMPGSHRTVTVDFGAGRAELADIEYQIIMAALEYSKHNLSRAARILGISRDAIRYRREKYESRGQA